MQEIENPEVDLVFLSQDLQSTGNTGFHIETGGHRIVIGTSDFDIMAIEASQNRIRFTRLNTTTGTVDNFTYCASKISSTTVTGEVPKQPTPTRITNNPAWALLANSRVMV